MWWMLAAATASLFPMVCLLYYFGERRDEKERKQRNEERYEKSLSICIESGATKKQMGMMLRAENRYDDLSRVIVMMEEYNENRNRKQRSR